MTVRELIFDSLENLENIYIDYGQQVKEMTPELYDRVYDVQVEKWYLDIKDKQACMVIVLDDY